MEPQGQAQTKIAIIGGGLIGPRHASVVLSNPTTQMSGLVDPGAHGPAVAEKLNTPHFSSIQELLDSPYRPDGAIVCTPSHTHVALSRELLAAGVHVMVEKPISTDIESGRELVAFAETVQARLLVGHHRRFNPYILAARASLGTLGTLTLVNGIWATRKPPAYFDPPAEWRRTKHGGPILTNLVHEIDLLQFLFGPITRIKAEKGLGQRGYDAEESGALTLRFESGMVGSFVMGDNLPSPHTFEQGTGENSDYVETGMDFWRIFGSEASLSLPDMTRWSYDRSEVKHWNGKLTRETIPVNTEVPAFQSQLVHFVDLIKGKVNKPLCTAAEALQALIVCNAIKEAFETGKDVDLGSAGEQ